MIYKVLSINIWFGGKVWDNLIEYITQEKPDILLIQEVYDSHNPALPNRYRTMEEFRKLFGDILPYDAFGPTIIDTGYDNSPWGNAVFSKFPIKSSRTVFFDLPLTQYDFKTDVDPRLAAEGMQEAELDINGKSVFVYSWHGVWNNHGGDTPQRQIMEKAIINAVQGKEYVLLAGDTNMDPWSATIQNIQKGLDLTSVFGSTLQSTFNMSQKKNPGNYANAAVDMVFVTKNIRLVSQDMPLVDVSDHYPLRVEIEL